MNKKLSNSSSEIKYGAFPLGYVFLWKEGSKQKEASEMLDRYALRDYINITRQVQTSDIFYFTRLGSNQRLPYLREWGLFCFEQKLLIHY